MRCRTAASGGEGPGEAPTVPTLPNLGVSSTRMFCRIFYFIFLHRLPALLPQLVLIEASAGPP